MSNVKEVGRMVEKAIADDRAHAIRILRGKGVKRDDLAEAYGVSPARISQIAPASTLPRPGAHQPDCAGQHAA